MNVTDKREDGSLKETCKTYVLHIVFTCFVSAFKIHFRMNKDTKLSEYS